ncbi:MAG: DEAD/DEAH box helicase [Ancalomicrobiaceae bacterium]|nr:DEAD/DEAH box helicase [Ancalomicrobiaceae bacterium]
MDVSDLEIAQLVGRSAFEKGRTYQRQTRVQAVSRDGDTIFAKVRGSGGNVYVTSVEARRGAKGRLIAVGTCSCPIGLNCKHVAAVLLAARALPEAALNGHPGGNADRTGPGSQVLSPPPVIEPIAPAGTAMNSRSASAIPARLPAPMPSTPPLPPDIVDWIERLGAQEPGDDYPPDITQRLIYVLAPHAFRQETPTLALAIKSVRLLKSGALSASASDYDPSNVVKKLPARFLRRSDLAILRAIAFAQLTSYGRTPLEGPDGGAVLADILKTGRARWQTVDGLALAAGPALRGRFDWDVDPKGSLSPRLTLDHDGTGSPALLLAATPPVYVKPAEGLIGPVETGLPASAALAMMQAPELAPAQLPAIAGFMRSKGSMLARLAPPAPTETVVVRDKPMPILELVRGELLQAPYGSHGGRSWTSALSQLAVIGAARLAFAYGPATVEADSPGTAVAWVEGQRLLDIRRNRQAEAAALRRLADLGLERAARHYPHAPALARAYCPPDQNDWFGFLYQDAPLLIAEGWQIRVAADFPCQIIRGDGDIEAGIREGSGLDWFELELGIVVDGERLDLVPLLISLIGRHDPDQLADALAQSDLVLHLSLPDGRYLSLPGARLRPYIDVLIQLFSGAASSDGALRFSTLDAAHLAPLEDLPGTVWTGGDRVRGLGRKLAEHGRIPDIAVPETFRATLRPYQARGLAWLDFLREANLGGILADDMGLGKTLQALALVSVEKAAGRLTSPALVIAPTSLMTNWQREAEKFAPDLTVLVLQGHDRKARFDGIDRADIVLSTYPLVARDKEILMGREWHILLLDEAQAIKNPNAATTRLVYDLKARHRFCLTGTPVENTLAELWSLFHFIAPGFLGDAKSFARDWRTPIEKKGNAGRAKLLAARVRPFLLRRTKDAVATDLPEKTEMVEAVALGPAQQAIYDSVRLAMHDRVRQALSEKGLALSRIILLDALLKLRQTCCDPRLLKGVRGADKAGSAKLERLMEMVEELVAEGRKLLVFSQFTSMLDLIRPRLEAAGIAYALLTGDTKDRAAAVASFQDGAVPVFLVSLKAGGVGLNLTAADTVILYDPWWNPAVEAQAIDRAHRIGQDKPVFVYKLTAVGTIEEKIEILKSRKAALATSLFDPDSTGTLDITEADIDLLFAE